MAVNVRMPEVHPRGLQFGILTFLLTAALLGGPRPAIAERGYLDRIRGVVEVPNPDQVRGLQPRIEVLSVDPQTARPDATIRVRLTAGVHMEEDRWKTQFRVTSEPGHAFFEGVPGVQKRANNARFDGTSGWDYPLPNGGRALIIPLGPLVLDPGKQTEVLIHLGTKDLDLLRGPAVVTISMEQGPGQLPVRAQVEVPIGVPGWAQGVGGLFILLALLGLKKEGEPSKSRGPDATSPDARPLKPAVPQSAARDLPPTTTEPPGDPDPPADFPPPPNIPVPDLPQVPPPVSLVQDLPPPPFSDLPPAPSQAPHVNPTPRDFDDPCGPERNAYEDLVEGIADKLAERESKVAHLNMLEQAYANRIVSSTIDGLLDTAFLALSLRGLRGVAGGLTNAYGSTAAKEWISQTLKGRLIDALTMAMFKEAVKAGSRHTFAGREVDLSALLLTKPGKALLKSMTKEAINNLGPQVVKSLVEAGWKRGVNVFAKEGPLFKAVGENAAEQWIQSYFSKEGSALFKEVKDMHVVVRKLPQSVQDELWHPDRGGAVRDGLQRAQRSSWKSLLGRCASTVGNLWSSLELVKGVNKNIGALEDLRQALHETRQDIWDLEDQIQFQDDANLVRSRDAWDFCMTRRNDRIT